jgi:hypothetical protein
MPDFGIMRGFNEKLFGDKLYAGQLPTQLGLIGSQEVNDFLLDSYPNSAAAYSVRKLRAAYSGSAIRVRRSSDNTETDIGFSGANLDTTALTSFCSGTNGFVTTWYDQSGNSRNATQTTAANQPQIVSSGSVILYGTKPTMRFDGVSDFINTPLFAYGSALSLYYVTQRIAAGSAYSPEIGIQSSPIADGGAFHYINPSLRGASYPFFPVFGNYDGIGTYANGDKYLINFDMTNSSGFSVYRNNALEQSVTSSGTIVSTYQGFTIASQNTPARYSNNNFSEVIMWLSNQSANRSAINSDMNTYFSVY